MAFPCVPITDGSPTVSDVQTNGEHVHGFLRKFTAMLWWTCICVVDVQQSEYKRRVCRGATATARCRLYNQLSRQESCHLIEGLV